METAVKLRAIESGRSFLSVSNVEQALAFDSLGRVIEPVAARKGAWKSFLMPVSDSESHRSTFFTNFGNFPLALALVAALLALVLAGLRRPR
jgi:apolipoprotein N-acyltransferase